jgi:hypothetical protein
VAQTLAAILLIATFVVEAVRLILKLLDILDVWATRRAARGTVPGAAPLGATA